MKSIKRQIFIICGVIISLTLIQITQELRRPRDPNNTLEAAWKRLFTDPDRSTLTCTKNQQSAKTAEEKQQEAELANRVKDGATWSVPRRKENHYAQAMIGWGPSAYLFDFLDDVLMREVVGAFKRIYNEAIKIKPEVNYKDPYTLENMTQSSGSEDELLAKISSLMRNGEGKSTFDVKTWKASVSVAQVNKILSEWKWYADKRLSDPAKSLVDRFDFNGDGRLSPKEFVIMMIRNNKNIAVENQCINCLSEIIKNTIDPIFLYLDCNSSNQINAENIWTNLQKLKRSTPNAFNFYKCDYHGGSFRTSAINDFIIKAKNTMDGYITKFEFRLAILQGYWSRHVDDLGIHENCAFNMKNLRWSEDGTVDKVCENLKKLS